MKSAAKDVIYVDIDDDITAIIEKVQGSTGKIVALVLPKRAAVMQSVVNMKLLKRTANESKKNVVLITSEAGLLPLAGSVGIHVAPTLQSKPEIPNAPQTSDSPISVDESDATEPDTPLDKARAVGEFTGAGLGAAKVQPTEDAIEIDNDEEEVAESGTGKDGKKGKPKGDKKLKVPDFNKFRVRLFIGVALLVLLIVGWIFATIVLPKATIVIKTDNVTVNTSLALTASVSAKSVDNEQMIVPGLRKEAKKTDSQKVPATGKKDEGTKAKGSMTVTNCINDGQPHTVPAGTTFTSGQFSFVSTEDVALEPALFSGPNCKSAAFGLSKSVAVTAAQPGDQYNLSARSYTVSMSGITASGSSMTGGVSKLVTVVGQADVDGAKQKVVDTAGAAAKQELINQLKADGYYPLPETFAPGNPLVTASPNVGDPANEVTVNVTVTYTMMGAKESDLKQLVEAAINKQIDTKKQKILDNGLDKAVVNVGDSKPEQAKFSVQTVAQAGVQQNSDDIRKAVAGKKKGEVQSIILARPGVKDVTVSYSPAWVYSTPKNPNKITITFQQSNGTPSK